MALRFWAMLAGIAAVAAPIIARTDSPPQVVFAIPGSAGGSGGVIDRFGGSFRPRKLLIGLIRSLRKRGVRASSSTVSGKNPSK